MFHIIQCLCLLLLTAIAVYGQTNNEIEIRTLSGEPDYRSVNLTWGVEDTEAAGDDNTTDDNESRAFTVYYCELQVWGPHRCKSKIVADNQVLDDEIERQSRQYSTVIGNLRMATKYLFHVKLQGKPGEQKASGRSDLGDNEIGHNGNFQGETIVIPTKGFLAHATKCLPDASEIEVETGPYFAGRIVAEGGSDCGVAGDALSAQEKYVMRIDHDKCGSKVDQETLTVKTFITVQENLGIFTHSTRRFVVVCTYQPDTLTVRASFSVPGKAGVAAVQPHWETDRSARDRKFRMVDKSALVLKEEATPADANSSQESDAVNSVANINEVTTKKSFQPLARRRSDEIMDNMIGGGYDGRQVSKFDRLINSEPDVTGEDTSYTVIVMVASLSVILIGALMFILHRERRRTY